MKSAHGLNSGHPGMNPEKITLSWGRRIEKSLIGPPCSCRAPLSMRRLRLQRACPPPPLRTRYSATRNGHSELIDENRRCVSPLNPAGSAPTTFNQR